MDIKVKDLTSVGRMELIQRLEAVTQEQQDRDMELGRLQAENKQLYENLEAVQRRSNAMLAELRGFRVALARAMPGNQPHHLDESGVMVRALGRVVGRRWDQMVKWGRRPGRWDTNQQGGPSDDRDKACVIGEESGEVARCALDAAPRERLLDELLDVAAAAVAWVEVLLAEEDAEGGRA